MNETSNAPFSAARIAARLRRLPPPDLSTSRHKYEKVIFFNHVIGDHRVVIVPKDVQVTLWADSLDDSGAFSVHSLDSHAVPCIAGKARRGKRKSHRPRFASPK